MGFSARLTAAMVTLIVLGVAATGALTYHNASIVEVPRALDRLDSHAQLLASDLETSVRGSRGDVLGIPTAAAVALEGIRRTTRAGGVDPFGVTTLTQWRGELGRGFAAKLAANPDYRQIRLIGAADGGREIARTDRLGPGNAVRIAPETELQPKGDRDYFQRAMRLHAGEVDISAVELDREHGAVDAPHVPIVRASTPVVGPDGRPSGIVVIDIDLREPFARARERALPGGEVYVVNASGDYLVRPNPAREFGSTLGATSRLPDDFPALADMLARGKTAPQLVQKHSGAEFGAALAGVRLAEGPQVFVVEAMPYADLAPTLTIVRNSTLAAVLMAAIGAVLLAIVLARSLTRPLTQMTAAIESFGHGEPLSLPTRSSGEIGTLARAFDRVAAEVREKTASLETEIAERRRLFASSLDLILIADREGTFIDISPSAEAILGYRPEEMIGRNGAVFVHPGDVERTRNEMRAASRGHATRNYDCRYVHRDGRIVPLTWSGAWLEQEQRYFFIGRDMTQRIALEQQLRQSQKLDAIGHLTGGVAHDFNNILTVITGSIEILADEVAQSPQLAAIARMVEDAAARGTDLTRQLLAFARKQPLQPRSTDVNRLILDTAKLLRSTLGESVEIKTTLEEDPWPAMVDPSQLGTALINLAVNARDAMPRGGKLILETHNLVLDTSFAAIHAEEIRPGPYVMIAVTDTGVGIPADIRDMVFEPFFTTKEVGQGTGLGLSMVYGFVKQSGGHIKIYSEESHGTTFQLYLPRSSESVVQVERPTDAAEGGEETILVVEDDALVRQYVIAQLESLRYAVLAAASAREALDIVASGRAFDLLFTDVILGSEVNGPALADEILRLRPGIKVLYTSGYTKDAIVTQGRVEPGVALITKPYRKTELAQKIRAVLGTPSGAAEQKWLRRLR
ncbi:ATP-binding protein [Bradyrhizobium sp.]|jgi:PAS domain S-box-containing protein|uniref:ATP-binding protein n=1 Tax=Bradyrhizobium sp. TaxID=376 RepID=UPI002B6EC3B6|nr:ATP-binding protein [Bradyrhizobium sp.]HWX64647.1 ATP-binding protein [Bradyrhizobium sp.]